MAAPLAFPLSSSAGKAVLAALQHRLSSTVRSSVARMFFLTFLLFGGAAALAIGYIYWNTNVLLERQLARTIDVEIQGLGEQYRANGIDGLAAIIGQRMRTPGNGLYLLADSRRAIVVGNFSEISLSLWEAEGAVEFRYRNPAIDPAAERLAMGANLRLPGGYRLIVGRDIEDRAVFDQVFRSALALAILAMTVLGLAAGWFVSRMHLARIGAISRTSRDIMAGDFARRIPVGRGADEFDRLAVNLNRMLDRIERLMTGMKEVTDNIAHDLRTPLTRLRQQAELILQDPRCDPGARRGLERITEEADQLIAMFDSLLRIARLEARSDGLCRQDAAIAPIVLDVVELFEPLAEEAGMTIRALVPDALSAPVEPHVLGQAIANLVENAIKYGKPVRAGQAAAITVVAARRGGDLEIVVADRGPGIPAGERARVVERFVRLDRSRSERGSGLGLSLVAATARSLDGVLELRDNDPGLAACLRFPL